MGKQIVMVSGLPGKMASQVAYEVAMTEDLELATAALGIEAGFKEIGSFTKFIPEIKIIEPERHEDLLEAGKESGMIVADFTQPDAVNRNAEMYCRVGNPFVMGTTGGDREKLEETVRKSNIPSVIAPNMCKQVVALQWGVEVYADKNPGALEGYKLMIVESHQKTKKDTSGTAKAMAGYFNKLGIKFDVSDIEKVRDPKKQLEMGVPEAYLDGHGWHTYILAPPKKSEERAFVLTKPESYFPTGLAAFEGLEKRIGFKELADGKRYHLEVFESIDKMMSFGFGYSADESGKVAIIHNINGRRPYALGTLDAVRFIADKVQKGQKGCYSMIDVIKGN